LKASGGKSPEQKEAVTKNWNKLVHIGRDLVIFSISESTDIVDKNPL
jgi:hypothetical protein